MSTPTRRSRVWGYILAPLAFEGHAVPDVGEQKRAVRVYAAANLLGDVTFFGDEAGATETAWADRPAGQELFVILGSGDTVIVPSLDRVVTVNLGKFCDALDRLAERPATLCVATLAPPVDWGQARATLRAVADAGRVFVSERLRKANRESGNPGGFKPQEGYGFKFVAVKGAKGQFERTLVTNDGERTLMRAIVAWRNADPPWSFTEIADHLNRQGFVAKKGEPWTAASARNAYLAELKLQAADGRDVE